MSVPGSSRRWRRSPRSSSRATGAELIGSAEAAREAVGAARQPDEEAWVAKVKATLRDALGDEAFAQAVRAGGVLSLTDAVARAVSEQRIRVSED